MRYDNDDQEMNRIYQESLHPKDYFEDSTYERKQKLKSKTNAFKQDIHGNVNRYSANKKNIKEQNPNQAMMSVMTIIGIIIITLVFILLPIIMEK